MDRPKPRQIRIVDGKHEAELPSGEWLACHTENDAIVMADIEGLRHDLLSRRMTPQRARAIAETIENYRAIDHFFARFFRRQANEIEAETAGAY